MPYLAHPRVDVDEVWEDAYKASVTTQPWEQARYLLETIGPRITAAALGLSDARQVKAWVRDYSEPREHAVAGRLAVLHRISYALVFKYGPNTAALWLRSSNPQLDDEVPLMVLRDGEADTVQGRLLAATRSFLEG